MEEEKQSTLYDLAYNTKSACKSIDDLSDRLKNIPEEIQDYHQIQEDTHRELNTSLARYGGIGKLKESSKYFSEYFRTIEEMFRIYPRKYRGTRIDDMLKDKSREELTELASVLSMTSNIDFIVENKLYSKVNKHGEVVITVRTKPDFDSYLTGALGGFVGLFGGGVLSAIFGIADTLVNNVSISTEEGLVYLVGGMTLGAISGARFGYIGSISGGHMKFPRILGTTAQDLEDRANLIVESSQLIDKKVK